MLFKKLTISLENKFKNNPNYRLEPAKPYSFINQNGNLVVVPNPHRHKKINLNDKKVDISLGNINIGNLNIKYYVINEGYHIINDSIFFSYPNDYYKFKKVNLDLIKDFNHLI